MKYLIFCLILLIAGCKSSNNENPIDGVYIASYEHEFGKSTDTLILKKANNGNGLYQITRHTGLIKKLDGKEFPKEILIKNWVLDYNADKQILTDQKEGKILVWDSNRLTLQLGDRSYKKISDL